MPLPNTAASLLRPSRQIYALLSMLLSSRMRAPSLPPGAGDKPETGKRSLSFPNQHEAATP